MVDVMNAYIARKPMHESWKSVIGTSFDGSNEKCPVLFPLFVGFLVLMLHKKEPNGYYIKEVKGDKVGN
jgi:hypothetical protein